MINYVKGFRQFINEDRFHHALPNSAGDANTRLRDEFRTLSPEEQGEIESLAEDLEKEGILSDFKKTMSRYNSIAQVKDAMIGALGAKDEMEAESSRLNRTGGWDIRPQPNDDDFSDDADTDNSDGGYYYSDLDDDSDLADDFESPLCKSCEGTGCEECDGSGMKRNPIGRF